MTRSEVGSARSDLIISSAGTTPRLCEYTGKPRKASRKGAGPNEARPSIAVGSDAPDLTDDKRSRSPSGQARCTSSSRCARLREKYALGRVATTTEGISE